MTVREPSNVSQSISTGDITSQGDVSLTQSVSIQEPVALPSSAGEFVQQINALIEQLDELAHLHADIKAAQDELRAAVKEAQEPKPEVSVIRRLIYSAKGLLDAAAAIATPLLPIVKLVAELAKQIPIIFGS